MVVAMDGMGTVVVMVVTEVVAGMAETTVPKGPEP